MRGGATADSQESQHLDLKEDPARIPQFLGNPDAKRIEVLLDTAICLANADGESFIVLGVADKVPGPQALTGTDADPADIAQKIFSRSRPNLTVETWAEVYAGARLVIIRVPQGLSVYARRNGASSIRQGTSCLPLGEDRRRQLAFHRANPDHTALPSQQSVPDLDQEALTRGRVLFTAQHPDRSVGSDRELLTLLGLLTPEGSLLRAAEILFGRRNLNLPLARHVYRPFPGGEPSQEEVTGPAILAIQSLLARIKAHSDPEADRIDLPTGQERPLPDFPFDAVDEVVLNAFAHRDWSLTTAVVVDQSPQTLRVHSPGGLPLGVRADRLLRTPSTPRNPVLMQALHRLGLVEETSRGFDRMWVSMLTAGRPVPDIDTDDFHVDVTFTATGTDSHFVRALAVLAPLFAEGVVRNVNTLLVLHHLFGATMLTSTTAGHLLQAGPAECQEILYWLVSVGLLEQNPGSSTWVLADRCRKALGSAQVVAPLHQDVERWILDAVKHAPVTNRHVAAATGAAPKTVTDMLRHLSVTGAIEKDPDGPQRGPTVRWRAR
ncbi:ATP-binding protein [Actinomyces wuliandei]|uniref:ATP-binding protein n=1 Tax=Actinomyces wuliandei TaxID=2057743 RepID=UPI00311A9979